MNAAPILETRGLEKRFGGVTAVAAVNFSLRPGELRCLIGPNGAGKSTFFKMLTGQLSPTAGSILLEGRDIVSAQPHEIGRRGVGIKNQVSVVMNGLTVRENLWLAARARSKGPAADAAVRGMAERLSLTPILERFVGELAHGQRQWVEIAMVIVCEPKIVLLNEPAAGMSDEETARTAELIRQINKEATIVVVEHDMQFIRQIAQTVTVFHQGRILVEDSFQKVVNDPVVRDVYLGRKGDFEMLEVTGLRSGYNGVPVLAGLSVTVAQGECVGVLGHNGMGKTTLLRTLMGILPATSGEIRFDGAPITQAPPHQRARLGIGYVPQGRGIFPGLSVRDNLRFAAVAVRRKGNLEEILAEFPRLEIMLDRPGGALSGGEQQLLAIARALIQQPRIVLLDEPTEGIQPSIIEEIVDQLHLLRKQRGLTMLLVEQNVDFIKALSDRVLLIQKGLIIREFVPEAISDSAAMGEF